MNPPKVDPLYSSPSSSSNVSKTRLEVFPECDEERLTVFYALSDGSGLLFQPGAHTEVSSLCKSTRSKNHVQR